MTLTSSATFTSRAAVRRVEPGSSAICVGCSTQVKFAAREQRMQAICNVYTDGRWNRVEHYHAECYDEAGQPYGEPAVPTSSHSGRSATK